MKPDVFFSLERPDAATLERQWTELEERADINFYLSWAWIGSWIEEAGPPDLVLAGRAGGELVCLGLLRRGVQKRHLFVRSQMLFLHQTGDEEQDVIFIEYNDFLTDRRFAPLGSAAVAFLLENAGRVDEIQIGGVAEPIYEGVKAAGFTTHVYARKPTAFVDLKDIRASGGDYLATLSPNSRYQIRRSHKAYQARGPLAVQPARNAEEALEFFEALGVLHERAWRERGGRGGWRLSFNALPERMWRRREPGGAWRFPFLVAFQKRVIDRAFAKGGIEIVRISCGDTPIGYIHCLVRDGWIGSYLSGFAYEADNKLKPGLTSFYLYIEEKLKGDAQVIDFLAGDERYKTSLGQPGPSICWFRVQERRPQLRLESALRRVKRRAEKLLGLRRPAD